MINKRFYIILLLLLAIVSCKSVDDVERENSVTPPEEIIAAEYVDDMFVIKVTEELAEKIEAGKIKGQIATSAFNATPATMNSIGIIDAERSFRHAGKFEARTRAEGMHLWYNVYLAPTPTRSVTKASAVMTDIEGVMEVVRIPKIKNLGQIEPQIPVFTDFNYPEKVATKATTNKYLFNDPMLSDQWHYYNDGSLSGAIAGCDINIYNVWEDYETGNPDVIVCIVDKGVDNQHEDLEKNIWVNEAEKNGSPDVDDDGNGLVDDIYGYNFYNDLGYIVAGDHGTHVGGTIGAVNNNGIGLCGVAGGDGVKGGVRLMSAQIFPIGEAPGKKSWEGIKYGADNGAVISQNSWGYLADLNPLDKDAIDYFIKYAGVDDNGAQVGPMKGGLVIFASGNSDAERGFPAQYDPVMAVSALRYNYKLAAYSNYGPWVDISAPGGQGGDNKGMIYSTYPNSTYSETFGTSMACPHVSGVAALIVSKYGGPGYTPDQVRARLIDSGKDVDSYSEPFYAGKIGPLLDAGRAIAGLSTIAPDAVTKFKLDSRLSNTLTFSWTVPADADDKRASWFHIFYSKTPMPGLNTSNIPAGVLVHKVRNVFAKAGETLTTTIKNLDFNQQYYFQIVACDFADNFSVLTTELSVKTDTNKPPLIESPDGTSFTLRSYEKRNISITIRELDQDNFTWEIEPGSPAFTYTEKDGNITATIDGTRVVPGSTVYTAKVYAEDQFGLSSTLNITYTISVNNAPETIGKIADMKFDKIGDTKTLNVTDYFKDKDLDELIYSFTTTKPSMLNYTITNNILTIKALKTGTANATLKATDPLKMTASLTFKIDVGDGGETPGVEPKIDIYPLRVIDNMNIKTDSNVSGDITIFNSAGSKVFISAFSATPTKNAVLNLKPLSGGVHTIVIKYGNKEIKQNFIKL